MPRLGFLPEPGFERLRELDERGPRISRLHVCTHLGTHVDAPSHFIAGGKDIGDFPAEFFLREGIVWPVAARDLQPIGLEDVRGLSVRRGDAVLLSTGWGEVCDQPRYYEHPYLDEELALWLVEQGAAFVGVDFLTPDKPPQLREEGFSSPIHRILLGNEVLIIENLTNLAPLAGRRVEVVAPPIHVRGEVEAAPARVLARAL
jgi:arylformamidase